VVADLFIEFLRVADAVQLVQPGEPNELTQPARLECPMSSKKRTLYVEIPENVHRGTKLAAVSQDRLLADVVTDALTEYLRARQPHEPAPEAAPRSRILRGFERPTPAISGPTAPDYRRPEPQQIQEPRHSEEFPLFKDGDPDPFEMDILGEP
jgi:hypothetical protein